MEETYSLVTANLLLSHIQDRGTPTAFYINSETYAKFCIEFKDHFKDHCRKDPKRTHHVKSPIRDDLGTLFGASVFKDNSLGLNILKVRW